MSRQSETLSAMPATDEAGFTLIEALVAIVILIFGLMAVSNLFLVATSSTSVANQSTAAAVAATEVLEVMRATPWTALVDGGNLAADAGLPAPSCEVPTAGYFCDADTPGVGRVHVRWLITPLGVRTKYVQVQAEGQGALSGARSRALFGMFRTCTDTPVSVPGGVCPDPPAGGGL